MSAITKRINARKPTPRQRAPVVKPSATVEAPRPNMDGATTPSDSDEENELIIRTRRNNKAREDQARKIDELNNAHTQTNENLNKMMQIMLAQSAAMSQPAVAPTAPKKQGKRAPPPPPEEPSEEELSEGEPSDEEPAPVQYRQPRRQAAEPVQAPARSKRTTRRRQQPTGEPVARKIQARAESKNKPAQPAAPAIPWFMQ